MSVGNAVGAVVGAVIGFYIGGPAGALKGAQLGMTVGGIVDPPKGPSINGPRLTDLTLQSSSYNAVIPRTYGTVALTGNIIWLENNRLKEVETKSKSGGKGGGGSEVTTYSYYATFAVALCKGPITAVRRIWIGPNLVYDAGSYDMATMIASNETASLFTLHTGTNTQLPDARMQATLGVSNTPAYRGLAYIVFKDLALKPYGNTLQGSQVKVEVVGLGSVSYNVSTVGAMPIVGTWTAIAWNGSVFCVIGYNTNIAMTSPDGVTWTQHTVPLNLMWNVLIWADTFFIAIAKNSNKCLISKDGKSWFVGGNLPFVTYWSSAVWNGSQICAIGYNKSAVSVNGLSWIGGDIVFPPEAHAVTWNGSRYMLGRNGYAQGAVSLDGLNWTNIQMPAGSVYWYEITTYAGWFHTVSYGTNLCAKSIDGINWTMGTMPDAGQWRSIRHDGVNFYAISRGSDKFAKSSDGLNWNAWPMNSGGSGYWSDIIFNGAVYVAVSENNSTYNAVIRPMTLNQTLPNLGQIVSSECIKTGLLSTNDIDVTALTQPVRGYRLGRISSLKTALEPLQATWPFDIIQSGYKLKFKPRGSASVVTIPSSALGSRQGE